MKLASTIARYLLGFMFTVFGFNGFFHFIPQPPPPSPLAQQFFISVSASHFMVLVFLIQIVGGILLLVGRYVPLALTLLAPIIVCILDFHITMDLGNIGPGALATILWGLVFLYYRVNFSGLLEPHLTSDVHIL